MSDKIMDLLVKGKAEEFKTEVRTMLNDKFIAGVENLKKTVAAGFSKKEE